MTVNVRYDMKVIIIINEGKVDMIVKIMNVGKLRNVYYNKN